jgi:hypothetical protein
MNHRQRSFTKVKGTTTKKRGRGGNGDGDRWPLHGRIGDNNTHPSVAITVVHYRSNILLVVT